MVRPNKYGGATTSMYFSDSGLLVRLQKLADLCQTSVSAILEGLSESSIDTLEKMLPKKHNFHLDVQVRIEVAKQYGGKSD